MRPLTQSDGHDAPGLIDELVAGLATMVDEIVVRFEHPVREPVVAHERPHVLNRVELGTFGWQRDDGDVGRYDEACRHVPAGLVDQEDSVGGGCNGRGDFREV